MRIYAIQRIEWQYNDEVYYTTDGEAGTICKAAKSKAAAEKECLKLNLEALSELITDSRWGGLRNYFYDLDELANDPDALIKFLGTVGGTVENHEVIKFSRKLTNLELQGLYNHLTIRWYRVEEVDVVDG